MSKTFDQSLLDTVDISMSMLDYDDISDTTSEEFRSLRREQQGCHNELTHREDFPFGKYVKDVYLSDGQSTYSLPQGLIQNVYIDGEKLKFTNDYLQFDSQKGRPTHYAVSSNPNKLVFYPQPNKSYTANVEYIDDRYVIDTDGKPQWEISIGSTLRMPEKVQHLYFDALEYYLLAEHLKKLTNPRYQPISDIAAKKWQIFLSASRTADSETYFVI